MLVNKICQNCKFWDSMPYTYPSGTNECRRYPPIPIFDGKKVNTAFPITNSHDSCGEFQSTEGEINANDD